MEPATKPVMDVAPPGKAPAPTPSPHNPASATPSVVQAPPKPATQSPVPVHPAPAAPVEEKGTTTAQKQSPGATDVSAKKKTTQKSDVPQAHVQKASAAPTGIIIMTIFVMVILAGLAIAVYSTSAK